MEDPKARKLLAEVTLKTREGRIQWKPTAIEGEFMVAIGGSFTVDVSYDPQTDGYSFCSKDFNGRTLFELFGAAGSDRKDLAELHGLARQQALKVDDKIDELLGELAKL